MNSRIESYILLFQEEEISLTASANSLNNSLRVKTLLMSLTNRVKKLRPRTEPSGTPPSTREDADRQYSTHTCYNRLAWKAAVQESKSGGISIEESLYSNLI